MSCVQSVISWSTACTSTTPPWGAAWPARGRGPWRPAPPCVTRWPGARHSATGTRSTLDQTACWVSGAGRRSLCQLTWCQTRGGRCTAWPSQGHSAVSSRGPETIQVRSRLISSLKSSLNSLTKLGGKTWDLVCPSSMGQGQMNCYVRLEIYNCLEKSWPSFW